MTAREFDDNGWFEIQDNPLSKVGVFPYLGSMIDPSGAMGLDPEGVYQVYRSAEELSSPETIESFKLLPWVDDHLMLGEDFDPAETKGIQGVIGEEVRFEDGFLKGNIKLFSESQADKVAAGKRELSCGYRCEYELKDGVFGDQKYGVVQTNIRGNHLASVDEGRMGSDVAVLDQQLTFAIDAKDFEAMKKTKTLQEFAQDGVEPDEMPSALQLIATALVALDGCDPKASDADDPDDPDKKGEDQDLDDDDKKGEDQDPDDDKNAADADPDDDPEKNAADADPDEKKEGMDALDAKVEKLSRRLGSRRQLSIKEVMGEIRARDALYAKVSPAIGAFDHQDMTAAELAVYACDKLELKPTKGHELTAINAYFTNRPAPSIFAVDSLRSDSSEKGSGAVAKHFAGRAQA
jgi:hypothetical protein